jgi:hypothetical protein
MISHSFIHPFAYCFCFWRSSPQWARVSSFTRCLDHKKGRITFGRTYLDEGSARRRDLYLKKHNTNNRQTSMPPVGFELTISAGQRPQAYAIDHAVTGIGPCFILPNFNLDFTVSPCISIHYV